MRGEAHEKQAVMLREEEPLILPFFNELKWMGELL